MEKQVSRLITSAAKIHAGQLVELAKQIQIEEIKNKLALKYPLLKADSNQFNQENFTEFGFLSKEGQE